jgi:hypothetical protein
MIISKRKGGLGNQMFQYAIGRSLAIRNNTDLKIDKSWYGEGQDINVERPFNIRKFKTECDIASQTDIHRTARFGESGVRLAYQLDDRLPDRLWLSASELLRVFIEEPFTNEKAVDAERTMKRPPIWMGIGRQSRTSRT